MIRQMGTDLPLSPALPALIDIDFAGTVEAAGEGLTGFAPGDEVYRCARGLADVPGTLAELIAADHRQIAHKPKSLSMREAAALPLVGITAYEGLQRAGAGAGQKVLVHGGTGGAGHVALPFVKQRGDTSHAQAKSIKVALSRAADLDCSCVQHVPGKKAQMTALSPEREIYATRQLGDAIMQSGNRWIGAKGRDARNSTVGRRVLFRFDVAFAVLRNDLELQIHEAEMDSIRIYDRSLPLQRLKRLEEGAVSLS